MKSLKNIPFHPVAVAIFPVLALLANNVGQTSIDVALRPLLIAIAIALALSIMVNLLIRNARKTAVVVSFILFLFFSYGHIYQLIKNATILNFIVGRHRYLLPAMLFILGLGVWLIYKKLKDVERPTRVLNTIGIILLIYPIFSLVSFGLRTQSGLMKAANFQFDSQHLSPPNTASLPDIYYIVLDTYTRGDALQRDFDFDNSSFLDGLKSLGFYVAECSRSNYGYTQGSITATLNLKYLSQLNDQLEDLGLEADDIWVLLKQSLARNMLEEIGYTTVAFETGYEWSRIRDADIYLAVDKDPIAIQRLDPFESMLIDSTIAVAFSHSQMQSASRRAIPIEEGALPPDFRHYGYAERQLFILDQLPGIPSIPEPTFTFVHFLIPHVPYIFNADGEIWSDPGFYSGELSAPINEWYWVVGYTSEIEFINKRLLEIVKNILSDSDVPPIILIQGDHGLRDDNRLQILNALFLPGGVESELYRAISPVNSFRIIFDNYFGTNYGLLPDLSYSGDDPEPIPETSSVCLE